MWDNKSHVEIIAPQWFAGVRGTVGHKIKNFPRSLRVYIIDVHTRFYIVCISCPTVPQCQKNLLNRLRRNGLRVWDMMSHGVPQCPMSERKLIVILFFSVQINRRKDQAETLRWYPVDPLSPRIVPTSCLNQVFLLQV